MKTLCTPQPTGAMPAFMHLSDFQQGKGACIDMGKKLCSQADMKSSTIFTYTRGACLT